VCGEGMRKPAKPHFCSSRKVRGSAKTYFFQIPKAVLRGQCLEGEALKVMLHRSKVMLTEAR